MPEIDASTLVPIGAAARALLHVREHEHEGINEEQHFIAAILEEAGLQVRPPNRSERRRRKKR